LLRENFGRFKEKWGEERAAGYRLMDAEHEGMKNEEWRMKNEETRAEDNAVLHSSFSGSVSLCMIVKNEEANLAECLKSVGDLVDEIVVVDTGSNDKTKEIALRMGARVFDFPWVDSFSAARNES